MKNLLTEKWTKLKNTRSLSLETDKSLGYIVASGSRNHNYISLYVKKQSISLSNDFIDGEFTISTPHFNCEENFNIITGHLGTWVTLIRKRDAKLVINIDEFLTMLPELTFLTVIQ